MLIEMFEEEKPKGSGEKLPDVPRIHKDLMQGHLNANVVLTGLAYFSPYTQRKNLDAQMFLFHRSSRSSLFRLTEVCLRYFSMSNQSREQLCSKNSSDYLVLEKFDEKY